MNAPRVSVVVPCYNAAWSIGRTLKSLQAQRFTDFEVLIINDGSRDQLHDAIAPFLAADTRMRLIDQANCGLAGARNRGIAEARAPLVAPIDSDDLWHPDFLAATVAALDAAPDAPFAYAYSLRMDVDDRLLPTMEHRVAPRHDLFGLISFNSVGSGSAAVYRADALAKVGGYDEALGARGLQGAEDWKVVVQLAAQSMPVLVPRYLVGYRFVVTGMSQSNPARQLDAILAVIDDLKRDMPRVPRRWFADARTVMAAWLMPRFIGLGLATRAVRELIHAYVLNPLWFRNPAVRRFHVASLGLLARRVAGARKPGPHLSEVAFDGERPFAFLASPEPLLQ